MNKKHVSTSSLCRLCHDLFSFSAEFCTNNLVLQEQIDRGGVMNFLWFDPVATIMSLADNSSNFLGVIQHVEGFSFRNNNFMQRG